MPGWVWSDEKRESLRQLWSEGYSSRQIAAQLGCTHNAVVGQARRLNLPYRAGPKASQAAQSALSRRAGAISAKRHRESGAVPASDAYRRQYERIHKAMLAKDQYILGYLLTELTEKQCRWPVGENDMRFCGEQKVKGMSYCEAHARRAYTAPTMSPGERARGITQEVQQLLGRAKVEAA